jgi:hypothetical protein
MATSDLTGAENRYRKCYVPFAVIMPNSAVCPREALMAWVRWPTNISRRFTTIVAAYSSMVFTGTAYLGGRPPR